MSSLRMTKRQWQNIGIGMAFLMVGIVVFAVLKLVEGSIVNKDGRDYIYTVDPNVFLVMFLISLIGLLIIFLTFVEYRWQSRSGETEVNIMDLIRKKEPAPPTEPVQEKEEPDWKRRREEARKNMENQASMRGPENVQAKESFRPVKSQTGPVIVKNPGPSPARTKGPGLQKKPEPIRNRTQETVQKIVAEPVRMVSPEPNVITAAGVKAQQAYEPVLKKSPEPFSAQEPKPLPVKTAEPVMQKGPKPDADIGSRPILESVPEKIITKEPEQKVPKIAGPKEPVQKGAPEQPVTEKLVPIRVEAIGRCPMCGKVIMLNQVECFKCGLKVNPKKLMPIGNHDDLN